MFTTTAPPLSPFARQTVALSPRVWQMANALTDSLLSFRLLKVGGFLIVDDMSYPGVAAAMAAFMEALGGEDRVELLRNEVSWGGVITLFSAIHCPA